MHDAPGAPRRAAENAWLERSLAAAALALGAAGAGLAAWAALAVYALLGPVQAIRALALSWLFASLNPALVNTAAAAAAGRYLVLGAAAVSTGLRARAARRPGALNVVDLWTLLLGAYVLAHSALLSPKAAVSVLKGASWLAAALVAVGGWTKLTAGERERLGRSLLLGLGAVVLAGLPLVAWPAAYMPIAPGFRGPLNHPAQYGIAAALLGAWATARLFEHRRPPPALMALAGACGALAVLAVARTAAVAMVAGVAAALLAAPLAVGRAPASLPGLRSWRLRAFIAVAALAVVSRTGDIATFVDGGRLAGLRPAEHVFLLDSFLDSRDIVTGPMLANIRANPWTGIGFGLASAPERTPVARGPFGIPVSAPVEKGVLPLALLEELGVFGLAAAVAWLGCLVRRAARAGPARLAVCLTIVLINLGESVLMSPGGMGLACLILLGWAAAGPGPGTPPSQGAGLSSAPPPRPSTSRCRW